MAIVGPGQDPMVSLRCENTRVIHLSVRGAMVTPPMWLAQRFAARTIVRINFLSLFGYCIFLPVRKGIKMITMILNLSSLL